MLDVDNATIDGSLYSDGDDLGYVINNNRSKDRIWRRYSGLLSVLQSDGTVNRCFHSLSISETAGLGMKA